MAINSALSPMPGAAIPGRERGDLAAQAKSGPWKLPCGVTSTGSSSSPCRSASADQSPFALAILTGSIAEAQLQLDAAAIPIGLTPAKSQAPQL